MHQCTLISSSLPSGAKFIISVNTLCDKNYIVYLYTMKQVLSLFMMLLILFADAGQTIYAHTCLKSNNVSYSLYSPAACKEEQEQVKRNCCEKKHTQEVEDCTIGKKDCCTVSGKYVKVPLGSDNLKATHINMPLQQAYIILFSLFTFEAATQSTSSIFYSTPPPLPYTHSQGFIQIFRC